MLASSSSSSPSLSAASGNQYLKEPNTTSSRSRANTSSPRPRNKIQQQHQESSPQFRPSSPNTINTVGTSTTSSSTTYNNNTSVASSNVPSKAATTDAGTQYTPPDWPPTSTRSSLYTSTYNIDNSAAAVTLPINEPPPTTTATPPNFEPTRPITAVTVPSSTQSQPQNLAPAATPSAPSPPPPPPAEPVVRVTPRTTLQQNATPTPATATTAIRRHHKAISETPPGTPTTSKRSKAQNPDVKVLPKDYWLCDAKTLAGIIADMLMELIRFNDEIPLGNGHLTRFHSRAPPGISVHDYLARLTYHATLSPPILLSMVYYIDKLCALYPSFTINSLTVHRFLITAATVASKGLSDSFWTNNTYARVGGVSLKELALLEIELLQRVQWRIVPSPEGLEDYYGNLVGRSEGFVVEGEDKEPGVEMNTEKDSGGADEDEDMDGREEKDKDGGGGGGGGVGGDDATRPRGTVLQGAFSSTAARDTMDTSTSSTSDEGG